MITTIKLLLRRPSERFIRAGTLVRSVLYSANFEKT